jgi:hypothetical protein
LEPLLYHYGFNVVLRAFRGLKIILANGIGWNKFIGIELASHILIEISYTIIRLSNNRSTIRLVLIFESLNFGVISV